MAGWTFYQGQIIHQRLTLCRCRYICGSATSRARSSHDYTVLRQAWRGRKTEGGNSATRSLWRL